VAPSGDVRERLRASGLGARPAFVPVRGARHGLRCTPALTRRWELPGTPTPLRGLGATASGPRAAGARAQPLSGLAVQFLNPSVSCRRIGYWTLQMWGRRETCTSLRAQRRVAMRAPSVDT
jgi:hypothetical protein